MKYALLLVKWLLDRARMPWPALLLLLLLLLGCAAAQEKQCDDEETTQLVPTDAAVASVLNDIHQHTSAAVCTAETVRPWPCRVHSLSLHVS